MKLVKGLLFVGAAVACVLALAHSSLWLCLMVVLLGLTIDPKTASL
jgi:hypothetical protein